MNIHIDSYDVYVENGMEFSRSTGKRPLHHAKILSGNRTIFMIGISIKDITSTLLNRKKLKLNVELIYLRVEQPKFGPFLNSNIF